MEDGSVWYGRITRRGLNPSWIREPKIQEGYLVAMNFNDPRYPSEVSGYLRKLVRRNRGILKKLKTYVAERLPTEVRINYNGYWTASEFKPYNGEKSQLNQLNHIWMAIKGSDSIFYAELHYHGAVDRAYFRTEVIARYDHDLGLDLDTLEKGKGPRLPSP